MQLLPAFLTLSAVLFFPLVVESIAYLRKLSTRGKQRQSLRDAWGRLLDRQRDFSQYDTCLSYRSLDRDRNYIDGQTWSDLNLNAIFATVDRTISSPGEVELYRILRLPEHDEDILIERDRAMTLLERNTHTREELQLALHGLGRFNYPPGVVSLLWAPPKPWPLLQKTCFFLTSIAYLLLSIGVIAAVVGTSFLPAVLGLILLTFLVNMVVHFTARLLFGGDMPSARYLGGCILAARRIARLNDPGLGERLTQLAELSKTLRGLTLRTDTLLRESVVMEPASIAQDYVAIMFLSDVRAFLYIISQLNKHQHDLQRLWIAVGELDAFQAIASYRQSLKVYARPSFDPSHGLDIKGAYHPLLANGVENSLNLRERNCVIMGSNMSGKSTFLRTIGINVILAQGIYTCNAREYNGAFHNVLSSISISDDIVSGKSLFMAEAERLLKIISLARSTRSLCLLDEILRGTNAAERIAAGKAILQYLANCESVTMVATHDLQMLEGLPSTYEVFHFVDHIDETGLHFDFRLCRGVPKTTNAIKILEYLGFPDEIVQDAERHHHESTEIDVKPTFEPPAAK
jgi:hypothetical protein